MEIRGVDISKFNGNFDFNEAKNNGYNFAILRAGYTGWGDGVSKAKDPTFEENYIKAKSAGLGVGCYYFSIATDYQKGVDEATWLYNNCLKGKYFDFPIVIDVEDDTGKKFYLRKAGKKNVTDGVIGFCETLENLGYYVMIYGSDISTFKELLDISRLDLYDKWVARYGKNPEYVKNYGIWQYSSENGLDKNIAYKDYPSIMKSKGLNGLGVQVSQSFEKYTVVKNDNLSSIAKKFGITWQQIYADNKNIIGDNPNIIKTGQVLNIRIM